MGEVVIPEEEKGYRCEVILDSVSPEGVRLVTMRWKYPLFVHAEALRHRCFSRSVASSRAIPSERLIAMVEQDPVEPVFWGRNQPGMQAQEELTPEEKEAALKAWHWATVDAVGACRSLHAMGVHKQIANRVLGPFQWVTEVVTGTDFKNFEALRCHKDAQPEIRKIAEMVRDALAFSEPDLCEWGQWHLPFITAEDIEALAPSLFLETLKKVSAARVARTSYRTHEGKLSTVEQDLKLYNQLVGSQPIHASPTEHLATPLCRDPLLPCSSEYCGNLRGWKSHRYEIPGHTVEG